MNATAASVSTRRPAMSTGRKVAVGCALLLTGAVALASYRYTLGRGPVPENIAANRHFDPWIAIHATGAATALLLAPLQLMPGLRRRRPTLHRITGSVYAVGCLTGGISALVLATGVSAGPVAGTGFGALGIAWLTTTGVAVRRILEGQVASHRRWMVRSFALTLAAVTLRIYLPLSALFGIDHLLAYRAISWACWMPNMALAEWYLRRSRHQGVDRPKEISAMTDHGT